MWPDYAEVEAMSDAGEWAMEEVYLWALWVWAPQLIPMVLPLIGDDESLPPDVDAVASEQSQTIWNQQVDEFIIPAVEAVWCWGYMQALDGLGAPLGGPSLTAGVKRPDPVADLMALAFDTNPDQITLAVKLVWDDTRSKARLERFISATAPVLRSKPGRMRDLLVGGTTRMARTHMAVAQLREELGVWLGQAMDIHAAGKHANIRIARRQGLGTLKNSKYSKYIDLWVPPASRPAMEFYGAMRQRAAESGLQTAGIINDATLSAASQSDIDFDKLWIARMDGHTRPAHFIADGQRVDLMAAFTVGGAHLMFPGDPTGPPELVKNCRCRVGMVKVDDPMPHEQQRTKTQRREINYRRAIGMVRAREDPEGVGYNNNPMAASGAPQGQEHDMNADTFRTFTDSVIAILGERTSDNRMLAADIEFSFRDFPLPLMWTRQSSGGHLDAFTIGVIESASIIDGKVLASGYLLNTAEADEAAGLIVHGVTGPSADLAAVEWMLTGDDGKELTEEDMWDLPMNAKVTMTMTKAELIGATLVATPAFGATMLNLDEARASRDVAVVAGAAAKFTPRVYDRRMFVDPQLSTPTLPTIDDTGRIFGHLACFGECHRSVQTECVIAPRSPSGYGHFHTSPALRLDDGSRLAVGRLTVGTGHANTRLAGAPAAAHYDDTGSCFALVRVGEDAHGIWFSGVAAPWATPEQVEQGLSAPLSGDWRDFGQGLDLVAALAVNTPAFAARGRDDEQGRPVTMVASLGPGPVTVRTDTVGLSLEDLKSAVAEGIIAADQLRQGQAVASAIFLTRRDQALARAAELVGTPESLDDRRAGALVRADSLAAGGQ